MRPRPESKDSTARSRSDTSTAHVDVIVLTTDTALLATLREAAGPAHEFFHAESPESAVDLLIGGRCGIFIIDVAVVRSHVVELFDRLQAQFPEVVLLATGRREEQNAVAGLVGSGRIYRFLHKPVSPARAELFLSAATRRYGEFHPQDSRSKLALGSLAKPRNRVALVGGSAAAIAIAIALGVWGWTSYKQVNSRMPVATAPQATPSVDDVLRRADDAFDAGNYVTPAGTSALDLYREALALDGNNAAARNGLEEIVTLFEKRMSSAIAARDVPGARDAFTALQRVAPEHPHLRELQNSLVSLSRQSSAQASSVAASPTPARAASASTTPAPHSATPNVDVARAFLAANQLVDPVDASALGSLRQARAANEDETAIQIAATDLGTRMLTRSLSAIEANNAGEAKAALDAAIAIDREFETGLPDLDRVAARIAELQSSTRRAANLSIVERATRLRQSGQLIEPRGDNAVEALQAALAADPSSPEIKNEQQRLSFALLETTRTALAAGDIDRADVLATRAEEVLPGLPQTRALREQIGAAREQREANSIVQAASLPRRREVPAVYPRDALLNAIEGWVDMEFVINADGVPRDVRVKSSQPPRVFDIAAVQALRQWRFEPMQINGVARDRRATLRMEFKLKD